MAIFRLGSLLTALLFTLLIGHILDTTTGQPLVGVAVDATVHGHTISAKTDKHGFFHLQLPRGRYDLNLSSADVPPQDHTVVVSGKSKQKLVVHACSTTLDYSCGGGPGGA